MVFKKLITLVLRTKVAFSLGRIKIIAEGYHNFSLTLLSLKDQNCVTVMMIFLLHYQFPKKKI